MLRAVLAVAMAAALLAVSVPVVETARVQYSDERIDRELDAIETAATTLTERNDPPPPGVPGPRQTITIDLPEKTWSTAGVAEVRLTPAADSEGHTTARWRVSGGTEHTRQLRAKVVTPQRTGEIVLRDGGRQQLVLELQADGTIQATRPQA